MAAHTDDVRSALKQLAEALLDDSERITERSVSRMQEMLPSYARVPREALMPVTLTNTRNLLEALRDPDADPSRAEGFFRVSGETRIRQAVTADEMLQAWRIGVEVLREQAHPIAEQLEIGDDVLLEFVEASLRWSDVGMRMSASAYRDVEIRELERLAAEQAALRRVATLVAQDVDASELFRAVAREVGAAFAADFSGIIRYESDPSVVTTMATWAAVGEHPPAPSRSRTVPGDPTSMVADTGAPARVDDWTSIPGPIAAFVRRELGVRSSVGSPIVVEGRLWGALAVHSKHGPLPADTESRLLKFTELMATAIANTNARAEVSRLADEQAALRRVATMVARASSPEAIFAQVAEEVALLLGVEAAVIQRYEQDGYATVVGDSGRAAFESRLTDEFDPFRVGTRLKMQGDSVTALVYRTGRSARFDSYEAASGSMASDARTLGLRSAVGSPIVVNGRLWGAIVAATSRLEPMPVDAESRIAEVTELLGTAISNAQARSDLAASRARIVATADDERRRVVRDLHDGAQQRLVHTVMTLKLASRALESGGEEAPQLVDEALRHAETATDELRELAHGILPSILAHGGLRAGVRALASRMSIPLEVDVSVDRLPQEVEATAYFVVAEALTNVAKHSDAQAAKVAAYLDGQALRVAVRDDGVGGAQPEGTGLVGLRDRLAVLDGSLHVDSPPEGGTLIAASIPVP
jgi:signal transduction histidine kinase